MSEQGRRNYSLVFVRDRPKRSAGLQYLAPGLDLEGSYPEPAKTWSVKGVEWHSAERTKRARRQ